MCVTLLQDSPNVYLQLGSKVTNTEVKKQRNLSDDLCTWITQVQSLCRAVVLVNVTSERQNVMYMVEVVYIVYQALHLQGEAVLSLYC